MAEYFDVIIVGAGLSGISAAYHLQTRCPDKTFAILEARAASGGTWDLFRYPGVRSDSDMYTLGYRWKPWREPKAIAQGSTILQYLRQTAHEAGIDRKIRCGQRVTRLSWSSERARWTVETQASEGGAPRRLQCRFVVMCSGYYRYSAGYTPRFEGIEQFQGRVVHPQHWDADVEYAGKRVVVIGSGATAITLVPALAERAAHVVMLQRSPTYVVSLPAHDAIADALRVLLPERLAYGLTRFKNVTLGMLFYSLTRRWPAFAKRRLIERVRTALGPGFDVETHFTPRYNVWDQRVCVVPDGDLFEALAAGRASIVTDQIERFTKSGLRLRSGAELAADLIVTATGLELQVLGGAEIVVDGRRIELNRTLNYKGCMFTDVPNLAYVFGYTNASWTLKADLTSEFLCRVLRHMDATGAQRCTPRRNDASVREEPWLNFSSGYVQRALHLLPKQGSKLPFRLYQNYLLDLFVLRHARVDDGALEFAAAPVHPQPRRPLSPVARPEP